MCGIAGVVGGSGQSADGPRTVEAMLQALVHRGPDEQRAAVLTDAVFGTARLALVDKPTSAQPMSDMSGRYLLSFNGEIYNYRELRAELTALGVRFRTSGDTEVLLYALIQWGRESLSRLRGQFALAFWDSEDKRLLLARDRFGIVPLFWAAREHGTLLFASEVKSLAVAGIEPRLSLVDLVDAVTTWGLLPGRSVFAAVNSVEPGGYVSWRPGEDIERGAYWAFAFAPTRDERPLAEQAEQLRELLTQAVERRLPAYGDPAVLLSGGLDSTAVAGLLRARDDAARIRSYSIQFVQNALDESPYQLLASQEYGTLHQGILCDDLTIASSLLRTVRHTEMPLVRTAPAASINLAAVIERDGVRAVLSGEGADELFCGYDLFKVAALRRTWADDPSSPELTARLEAIMRQQRDLGRAIERAFYEQGVDAADDPLFSHVNRWSAAFRASQYLAADHRRSVSVQGIYERARARLPQEHAAWSTVERAQYLEASYFLSTALLGSQCDRPYMAHSIEARYPFLDEDVVDFALTLPEASKLQGSNEKAILKAALTDVVPTAILGRVKQPYTAPEGDIFRSAAGRQVLGEFASPAAIADAGIFDAKRVGWLVEKLERTRTSFHDDLAVLWIVTTQMLAREYGVAPAA